MRLAKRKHGSEMQVNMTPMIDVTFLLLIFFMTVNQVSNINKEQLELPKLKGSQDQSEAAITINIDRDGQIIVSGNEVSLVELASLMSDELAKPGTDPQQLLVAVRAARDGTCRSVNDVIEALVKLDITRVRIAVESTPE